MAAASERARARERKSENPANNNPGPGPFAARSHGLFLSCMARDRGSTRGSYEGDCEGGKRNRTSGETGSGPFRCGSLSPPFVRFQYPSSSSGADLIRYGFSYSGHGARSHARTHTRAWKRINVRERKTLFSHIIRTTSNGIRRQGERSLEMRLLIIPLKKLSRPVGHT